MGATAKKTGAKMFEVTKNNEININTIDVNLAAGVSVWRHEMDRSIV